MAKHADLLPHQLHLHDLLRRSALHHLRGLLPRPKQHASINLEGQGNNHDDLELHLQRHGLPARHQGLYSAV